MMEKIEEEKRPRIRYQNARYDFELNLKPMQKILQFSTFLSQSPKNTPKLSNNNPTTVLYKKEFVWNPF